jgi:hypothetical protein
MNELLLHLVELNIFQFKHLCQLLDPCLGIFVVWVSQKSVSVAEGSDFVL